MSVFKSERKKTPSTQTHDTSAPPTKNRSLRPSTTSFPKPGNKERRTRWEKTPEPLRFEDCRDQEDALQTYLEDVSGLTCTAEGISNTRPLDEQALSPMANAIDHLVNAQNLEAAWKLVRMFNPKTRLALLESCSLLLATKAQPSNPAKDNVLSTVARVARTALRYADLPQFLKLLPLCTPEARTKLYSRLPAPTVDDSKEGGIFVNTTSRTLEWVRALEPNVRNKELKLLLSSAETPMDKVRAASIAMVIALAVADLPGEATTVLKRAALVHGGSGPPLAHELLKTLKTLNTVLVPGTNEFQVSDSEVNKVLRLFVSDPVLTVVASSWASYLPESEKHKWQNAGPINALSPQDAGKLGEMQPPLELQERLDLYFGVSKEGGSLDDDAFIDAMRATLVWVLALDEDSRNKELDSLLTAAGMHEGRNFAKAIAIKCIFWPVARDTVSRDKWRLNRELTSESLQRVPASFQAEVLSLAVEQAIESKSSEEDLDRLLKLQLRFH